MVGGGKPRRGLMSNVAMTINKENTELELKKLTEEYTKRIEKSMR